MTAAQLAHPLHDLFWQWPRVLSGVPRRKVARSSNAVMWRAIGTGLAFALIGLMMMVFAIGAAGVAPAADPGRDTLAAAHAAPGHRVAIYQDQADALAVEMPVP